MYMLAQSAPWYAEWLGSGHFTQLIVLLAVMAVPIVAIVMYYWRLTKKHQTDARLKEQMIARGYTADEIVRVLAADAKAADARPDPDRTLTTTPSPKVEG